MCHVLIIEDEPLTAMLIETLVGEIGATSCTIAATQEDAIAAAVAQPPDVITSDVRLIEGTGPLAVQAIAARIGSRPVIYITAEHQACEPRAEASIVLTKPVYPAALRRAFQQVA